MENLPNLHTTHIINKFHFKELRMQCYVKQARMMFCLHIDRLTEQ